MANSFELIRDSWPEWATERATRKFKETLIGYLNHPPARPVPTPAAMQRDLLLPPSWACTIPELKLEKSWTLGGYSVGIEPRMDEWTSKDRYNLKLKCHDKLSLIGWTSSILHEENHTRDMISVGGLPLLLAYEVKIAGYKPLRWNANELATQLDEACDFLKPQGDGSWQTLQIQLEAKPTMSQLLALTNKEFNEKLYQIDPDAHEEEAADAANPEYRNLFIEALRQPRNKSHLMSLDLLSKLELLGYVGIAQDFCDEATCLGFTGESLLRLGAKIVQGFRKAHAMYDWERMIGIILEAADLSYREYERKIFKVLDNAASATQGNARVRLRSLESLSKRSNACARARRRNPKGVPTLGYGAHACYMVKIGSMPYILNCEDDPSSNSEIESALSFYADFKLTLQAQSLMKEYLKSTGPKEKRAVSGCITCPLKGAVQPPWCPDCSGELKIEIKGYVMNYERTTNVNDECPIVKEWLGEKRWESRTNDK
jgi:hypothetical protein